MRLAGLLPRVEEHLAKIAANPENTSVSHWEHEVHDWLKQMEDMIPYVGKKTAARRRPPNGPYASKPGEVKSRADPMDQDRQFENLMGKVFDRAQVGLLEEAGPAEYERRKQDFIFHMQDWKSDIKKMSALIDDPGKMGLKESTTFVIGFLYHVIPHLNAAGHLLLDDVPDPFATKVRSNS